MNKIENKRKERNQKFDDLDTSLFTMGVIFLLAPIGFLFFYDPEVDTLQEVFNFCLNLFISAIFLLGVLYIKKHYE